jgi:acetoin utilization deacetylase AcuC-like enzyme
LSKWPDSSAFPILFASTHQFSSATDSESDNNEETFYPGTGSHILESDPVYPYIINIPLRPGTGSAEWRNAVATSILPRLITFRPDIILFSAGFDSHKDDEVGDLELVDEVCIIIDDLNLVS